ncbi:BadF/BadG/BcrA/BcrD ATPase family protein [Spirosoma sp. KUDC1026]|uniref:BadF/BadG/BcrA/BcrD ATPase family protein n=1 Tax=Spirosoma sp. KUDC1026 TaxID=2745947 RepID=UPI00159BA841|nr:BadF/BadG/BcrA/BcrD ATPase family protein [Spirosoma sp. KUDC1026]QKZ11873.1 N-acetylglucosamine kinase [Spirosoma sp. KUDC1026]
MILIADSGSTKTDWLLIDRQGSRRVLQTNGFNPYYQTTEQVYTTLQTQLLPELPADDVTDVFFYGAGCSGPAVNHIIADAIRRLLPKAQTVDVNSDMLGAARSAAGHESGIVCILGTGSNACRYDGSQITQGILSLGFWLGDEGSGGYLGKTLVRDFFQNRLPDDLRIAFVGKYALDRPTLLENAYQKPYPNRYFAGFTPFLTEHLTHPYVQQLVIDAFRLFLETYVVRLPDANKLPIHFVGSIAYYFKAQLGQAVSQAGLALGRLVKSPIDQLADYHRA